MSMQQAVVFKKIRLGVLYVFMGIYSLVVFYPIFLMLLTSFKTSREIFANPFGFPVQVNFENFRKILLVSNYPLYFLNSILVTLLALAVIVILSSLAAFILAKYRFRGARFLYLFFTAGMIIPIKLGTISIMKTMIGLGLYDSLASVIIVFASFGIPFGVFILTEFIRMIPDELISAARIDGATEPGIFYHIILPMLKPAMATVAIVTFIPVWNDFWFPLVLLKSEAVRTVPLATALLFGQHQTDYGMVFGVLVLASLPVISMYLLFSRYFQKGIASGAIKG